MTASQTRSLHQLARLYGVQTSYDDVDRQQQLASLEPLLAVLQSLGAPIAKLEDAPHALREKRLADWRQVLAPVTVAWEGRLSSIEMRLPSSQADADMKGALVLDTGGRRDLEWRVADFAVRRSATIEGEQYMIKRLPVPTGLPRGYHRLAVQLPGGQARAETLIVSAPRKTYRPADGSEARAWGVFIPTYALHTATSWGAGDFSDLEELVRWVAGIGGGVVATLPLLAAFLDEPFEPSPYSPASRLLWNPFYVNVARAPELSRCPSATQLLQSPPFMIEIEDLRNKPQVDYRSQMALKRRVLEELAECCFAEDSGRLQELSHFITERPEVERYARFRAVGEKAEAPWQSWPERLKRGDLREGDYDEKVKRYHLYAQWLADQQLQSVAGTARENGVQLYLDFPLGVHPRGYDVWEHQDVFVHGVAGGAPPDTFFREGQNWSFPPLHPEVLRHRKYDYFISCLRHSLRHAGILRTDHVMGLHRLYWIPRGMEARQGVYVRYPAEEMYAILALESHLHKAAIVGEDLGTVPPEVRPAMARHGLHRMYVVQYALTNNSGKALPPLGADMVASMNTHDMLPFASFYSGCDVRDRFAGHPASRSPRKEQRCRDSLNNALVSFLSRKGWIARSSPADALDVLRATLSFLSDSPAPVVLASLEDLWLETQAQNVPGTRTEHPNWRGRARYALEEFRRLPQVVETLESIDVRRKGRC